MTSSEWITRVPQNVAVWPSNLKVHFQRTAGSFGSATLALTRTSEAPTLHQSPPRGGKNACNPFSRWGLSCMSILHAGPGRPMDPGSALPSGLVLSSRCWVRSSSTEIRKQACRLAGGATGGWPQRCHRSGCARPGACGSRISSQPTGGLSEGG